MKTFSVWAVVLTLVIVLAVCIGAPGTAAAAAVAAHPFWIGVAGMVIMPWTPQLSYDQLVALSDPQAANQPEVIAHQFYDTQNVVTAQVQPITFFGAANADKTLSNMNGPGQLPDPQFFIIQYVAADVLIPPTSALTAAFPNPGLTDMGAILLTGRPTFEISMADKLYGPYTLSMCQGTGGVTGFGYGFGTAANGADYAVPNNGNLASGGFPFSGSVVIPPKIQFSMTVRWNPAGTGALSATRLLRMSMVGILYRKVQ